MKLLTIRKDGGDESHVTGFFLVEIKSLFSIVLLKFSDGSRDAYHNHAFNAISWVLSGRLEENHLGGDTNTYVPSFRPIHTARSVFHKVVSVGNTYALSFRGPWTDRWWEFLPQERVWKYLTHGRRVVGDCTATGEAELA